MTEESPWTQPFMTLVDGQTRVQVGHLHLERHGLGAEDIARSVGSKDGWPGILEVYANIAPAD